MKPTYKLLLAALLFAAVSRLGADISLPQPLLLGLSLLFAAMFAALWTAIFKSSAGKAVIKNNLAALIGGGLLLAIAVILFFETAAQATVSVAFAWQAALIPLVTAAGFLFLRERPPLVLLGCLLIVTAGAVLMTGVTFGDFSLLTMVLSLISAVSLTALLLLNKNSSRVPAIDALVVQLLTAAVLVLAYTLWKQESQAMLSSDMLLRLLLTSLLFAAASVWSLQAIKKLSLSSSAAVLFIPSALVLLLRVLTDEQTLDPFIIIGAVMILGGGLIGSLVVRRK